MNEIANSMGSLRACHIFVQGNFARAPWKGPMQLNGLEYKQATPSVTDNRRFLVGLKGRWWFDLEPRMESPFPQVA